ncbi:choice-of-anchor J domain-containing protein, partial [Psychroserpens sp. XS_ASV72]|uniref:choice-of-anchor J domain-containing protein n=1 Tax=Psychroserpens sp. XS_ASV72 TaxID=3241293 RepID=UPI0035198F1E
MKKVTFLLLAMVGCFWLSYAQTVNEPTNWPNASWTLSGTYDAGALLGDPTVDANFSYDDDAAGSGSTDILIAESPVIDLTAAVGNGETELTLDFDYNYNLGSVFDLEYYDADAASWVTWQAIADNSSTTSNWCGAIAGTTTSSVLDVSGFTATQQSGFRYRFNYDASSVFGWGFCISTATLNSAAPVGPTIVDCSSGIPVNTTYCYGNSDTTLFTYQSNDTTPLKLTFNAGGIESCCDNITIYDSDGTTVLYNGNNGGDLTGVTATSTGDTIYLEVDSDTSVSCASASGCCTTQWDWNVICASCTAADLVSATVSTIDCVAGTFYVDVLFDEFGDGLGDGEFLLDDVYGPTFLIPGTYSYQLGPFTTSSPSVNISVFHTAGNSACDFSVGDFEYYCPPDNDLCADATALACDDTLTGQSTISATGGSGTSCNGTIGDDVWYQYSGDDSTVTITVTAIDENAQIGVYESTDGTCAGFTLGTCLVGTDPFSTTATVEFDADIGTEYFIQVGNSINGDPGFNFDIAATCVPYPVLPPNCDAALTSALVDFPRTGTLTWSDATGSPDGYRITVGSSMGGNDIADNVDVGAATSYAPSGLAYASTYYVTITPYNFNGDATGCTEETFDTEALPPAGFVCESAIDIGALPYAAAAETTSGFGDDYSGSAGASGCGSTSAYLNGDDKFYAFTAASDGSINVDLTNITDTYTGVFIYNDCGDVGVACAAGDVNANATTDLAITNFPVSTGNTYYIVVSTWASPQTTTYDLSVTAGASCIGISDLSVDTVGPDSVTLSWTANSGETAWEVAIQPDGTGEPAAADGSGTDTTNNPYTSPATLSEGTAYEAWVRAECTAGTEFGDWVGPIDFTTTCSAFGLPFSETFDSTSTTENCWTVLNENADGDAWDLDYTLDVITGDESAALYTDFNGGANDDWLISPTITLTGNERLKFKYSLQSPAEPNDFEVLLSTSGTAPASFTNTVLALASYNDVDVDNGESTELIIDISAYSGDVNIAWHVPPGGDDGWRLYIDDVVVEEIPSCPDVSGIAVSSITTTSAQIDWTGGGVESAWEVAVVAAGSGEPAAADGTGADTATNSYTATVTSNTSYDVYVRAECTAGTDFGAWIGPVNFSSACDSFALPFSEGFDSTSTTENCWTVLNENADGDAWNLDYTLDVISGDESAAINTDFNGGNNDDWLITPVLTLTGNDRLIFRYSLQSTFEPNDFEVLLSTTGTAPASFTNTLLPLASYGDVDVDNGESTELVVDLTGYSGDVNIAWHIPSGGLDGWRLYIDDVVVEEIPDCTEAIVDTTTVVEDCGTGFFSIDVEFTSVGDATDISDGTDTFAISGTSATAGPYANGTIVNLDVVHSDGACDFTIPGDFTDACPPVNDDFANAIPLVCGTTVFGNTTNATLDENDAPDGVDSDTDSPNVWYSYFGNGQTVSLDTCLDGTDYDTEILVFTGTSGNLTFVAEGYDECDGTNSNFLAQTSFVAEAGIQYWISVEGWNATSIGFFEMSVTCTGTEDFVYNMGTWTPSDPTGTTTPGDIYIAAGNAVMTGATDCNSFTIRPGGGATIPGGASVTTAAGMTLESTSTTYSSLILDGTVGGTINYERHVNINGTGSTGSNDLVSAPLSGQAFSDFAAANPNLFDNGAGTLFLFGPFDKSTGDFVTYANTETATLGGDGVGYRAATDDNGTLTFTGTAENGTVANDIQNSGPIRQEWNLVGNPYPSYMNVQTFLSHDVGGVTNLALFEPASAAIYGYDGSATNGWTIYNLATTTPSTVMAPGQGFFVSANAANVGPYDLEFSPDIRSTGTSDDFIVGRNAQLTYMILDINTSNKSFSTDFYFTPNASQGFDLGYDAAVWGDGAPEFAVYSHLVQDNTGVAMALQALNGSDLADVTIPLGVNANQGEQLTFSISDSTLPASVEVYLEDTVANTLTLLNDSDYVI